jgi:thiamine-phosphate pyrophosphorylase
MARAVEILMPVAQSADVAFILNDRPDLASRLGCDGVHIGQEDASTAEARAMLGPDRIVGVTCHASRHLAVEAAEAGADYVAFGAFFPTATKEAKTHADLDLLQWWSELMVVPCVAIGGITVQNAAPLITAGADFLAVSSGIWDYPDGPDAAVKAFNALF